VSFEGDVFIGADTFRQVLEQFFAPFESVRLVVDEVTRIRAGDSVLAVGTATYQMQLKDGTSQQVTERWTDVRVKQEGRWVYAMDHIHLLASPSP
jgi:ketosteroid isomerase-like protein